MYVTWLIDILSARNVIEYLTYSKRKMMSVLEIILILLPSHKQSPVAY